MSFPRPGFIAVNKKRYSYFIKNKKKVQLLLLKALHLFYLPVINNMPCFPGLIHYKEY